MDISKMEVMFGDYCKKCKHFAKDGAEEPCNECLETWYRDGTRVPVKYESQKNQAV